MSGAAAALQATGSTITTTTKAATSEAAAPRAPEATEQIATALSSLRNRPDGSYRVRVELKPPELGRVELRVELRDGVVSVQIQAERAQTSEVLRQELARLREHLTEQGVRAGDLTVDAQARHGASDDRAARDARSGADARPWSREPADRDDATDDPRTFRGAPRHGAERATAPGRIDIQA